MNDAGNRGGARVLARDDGVGSLGRRVLIVALGELKESSRARTRRGLSTPRRAFDVQSLLDIEEVHKAPALGNDGAGCGEDSSGSARNALARTELTARGRRRVHVVSESELYCAQLS